MFTVLKYTFRKNLLVLVSTLFAVFIICAAVFYSIPEQTIANTGMCHSSNETPFGGMIITSVACTCGVGTVIDVLDIAEGTQSGGFIQGLRLDTSTNACLFQWLYPIGGCILGDYSPNQQGDECEVYVPPYECIEVTHMHHAEKIGTSMPAICLGVM